MSKITVFEVPYDSGYRSFRMGRGPERLVATGVADRIRAAGHEVRLEKLEVEGLSPVIEPGATFTILRDLALLVRGAVDDGSFPLVLAGNCIASVATVTALNAESLGVVWFDAHGDLNTPETSPSGYLDGMALSVLMGHCWTPLSAGIGGFRPLPPQNVVLVAARDLDPGERKLIETSGLRHVAPADIARVAPVLDELAARAREVHLHLDLDALDPELAKVNPFAAPGGLMVEQIEQQLDAIGDRFQIVSAAVTAYDPSCDPQDRGLDAALSLIEAIVRKW